MCVHSFNSSVNSAPTLLRVLLEACHPLYPYLRGKEVAVGIKTALYFKFRF